MRLLLLRHAPTAETGKKLTGRTPGVAISAAGSLMAERAGASLTTISPAALYTSPVQRCRETADIIGTAWGLEPIVHDGFIEVDYGTWAGRSLATLRRTNIWKQLFVAPSRVRFPDGESIAEVQARSVAACEQLAGTHPKGIVAVVSHADVIRTILAHYLGTPLDLYQRLDVAPVALSIVDIPPAGFPRVPVVNSALPAEVS